MTTEEAQELGRQAWEAFLRDVPTLWEERPGQFVAYQGSRQIGFAKEQDEMYQECYRRGLRAHEFTVFCIEAPLTEFWTGIEFID